MSSTFKHNDLRFYVRALFDLAGIDIRYMVPGYQDVVQAMPQTIEGIVDTEDKQNSDHMKSQWLVADRALQAVGMRESTGYKKTESTAGAHSARENSKDREAYIGLARINAERAKGHLYNVPLQFEIVPNNPTDRVAIQGVNRYRDEILNANNWSSEYIDFISDGHDFGSGIVYNPYKPARNGLDEAFLEERARQGQPIEYDEYMKLQELAKSHVLRHIDTFSVIRDRRARGEHSADFSNPMHTITTWMEPISVTEAMQKYPDYKDKITPGISRLFRDVNPRAGDIASDDLMTMEKHTWIQCPVEYEITYQVHVGEGYTVPRTDPVKRTAVLHLVRLESCGIVEMHIDEYAHRQVPLTMWQRRPSKYHAYGIGAYKDMFAAEWAYNIAFNGKFHWFNRMAKGGGFYFKGVLNKDQIEARTKEHAWVAIDPNELPANLRNQPLGSLIYDTRPQSFPSVYDNLEMSMETKVKDTGGWHGVAGQKSGSSGRQEQILRKDSETGMEPTIRNLEKSIMPMGVKFYSNIVQFDSQHEIEFDAEDPRTGEVEHVELNKVLGEVDAFDPETGEWKLLPYMIRNSVKTLRFSVQVATRSIVPINPTERRFFWLDTLSAIFPYTQSEEGVTMLDQLDKHVYNGLFTELVAELRQMYQRNAKMQQQAQQEQMQLAERQDAQQQELEMIDRQQNKYRLEQKALSDLMKALAAFQKGDSAPLQDVMNRNPNLNQMIS